MMIGVISQPSFNSLLRIRLKTCKTINRAWAYIEQDDVGTVMRRKKFKPKESLS